MENYTLVRPEHLNHHGFLFGGQLLLWVDEYAWMAAAREFPGCLLVTIGMEHIQFKQPVVKGSILHFRITHLKTGTTSVTYAVDVCADAPGSSTEEPVFATEVTFVRVDEKGHKLPLPAKNQK